jgi:hypothetical protein
LVLNEVSREIDSILDVEEQLRRAVGSSKRVIDYQILVSCCTTTSSASVIAWT